MSFMTNGQRKYWSASMKKSAVTDDDDMVVFVPSAYSVVSSWVKDIEDDEEDSLLKAYRGKKPLYSGSQAASLKVSRDSLWSNLQHQTC
jgi:hypothetical protein